MSVDEHHRDGDTASSCSCETCSCDFSDCSSCCSDDGKSMDSSPEKVNKTTDDIDNRKDLDKAIQDTEENGTDNSCLPEDRMERPPITYSEELQKEINEIERILDGVCVNDRNNYENEDITSNDIDASATPYASTDGKYSTTDYITTNENSPINFASINQLDYTRSSGFNCISWDVQDEDEYNDVSKLYTKLVSLDLYTYMYIIENVLDECVRNEIEDQTFLSI